MKRFSPLAALLLLASVVAVLLAGCAVQPGEATLGWLRNGALWVAAPDGSNARMVAQGDIVSFAWSPDHRQIVFRTGRGANAQATALPAWGARAVADAPTTLAVVGINGGVPMQISPDAGGVPRSDAWWAPGGTRLLSREEVPSGGGNLTPVYVVSQADQPVGIARKPLDVTPALPVLAPDGLRVASLDATGALRVGAVGQGGTVVATDALLLLPGTGRPAHLLWQPRAEAVLYPAAAPGGVALTLRDLRGGSRVLATVPALLDAAFSPDGSLLLLRTPEAFEVRRVAGDGAVVFRWAAADPAAQPWWAPDGRHLLIQDASGWSLVNVAQGSVRPLLAFPSAATGPGESATTWRPALGGPWSGSGGQFLFTAPAGATWQGSALPGGSAGAEGALYVASVAADGTAGAPRRVAAGPTRAALWSYVDPSTAFLSAS